MCERYGVDRAWPVIDDDALTEPRGQPLAQHPRDHVSRRPARPGDQSHRLVGVRDCIGGDEGQDRQQEASDQPSSSLH
jgi:hypothetical protein